jgi:glutamate formiminotransferase
MRKIVECVPNISEGRDEKIIIACADAVENMRATLLASTEINQPVFLLSWRP